MPGYCEVVGCKNNSLMKKHRPSFHRFPKNLSRRARWIAALQKKKRDLSTWEPSNTARICGAHFLLGKPSNDSCHPDYVPSLFPHDGKKWTAHLKKLHGKQKNGNKRKLSVNGTQSKESEGQIEDLLKDLPHSCEEDDQAVWLYTVHGGKVISRTRCPDSFKANKKGLPLTSILMANLLTAESETSSNQAEEGPITKLRIIPPCTQDMLFDEINALRSERDEERERVTQLQEKLKGLSAKLKKKNNKPPAKAVDGPPTKPKMLPPCTQDMLFQEINALRSERDEERERVKQLQEKLEILAADLKKKSKQTVEQSCENCHKNPNGGLPPPQANSQTLKTVVSQEEMS